MSAVVKIESYRAEGGEPTDYIRFTKADGSTHHVLRWEALVRAKGILNGLLEASFGGDDPIQMEKDIWLCHQTFKAVIQNGRDNGKNYNKASIKFFEDQIRQVERSWKDTRENQKLGKNSLKGF